jgi:hypothetical protein
MENCNLLRIVFYGQIMGVPVRPPLMMMMALQSATLHRAHQIGLAKASSGFAHFL